jgi:hypothetical protein
MHAPGKLGKLARTRPRPAHPRTGFAALTTPPSAYCKFRLVTVVAVSLCGSEYGGLCNVVLSGFSVWTHSLLVKFSPSHRCILVEILLRFHGMWYTAGSLKLFFSSRTVFAYRSRELNHLVNASKSQPVDAVMDWR